MGPRKHAFAAAATKRGQQVASSGGTRAPTPHHPARGMSGGRAGGAAKASREARHAPEAEEEDVLAGDEPQAGVEYEPIEYEEADAALPWMASSYDLSRAAVEETGFFGLEELPAGSYELVRSGGSVSLRAKDTRASKKGGASTASPRTADSVQAPAVAGKKRARVEATPPVLVDEEEEEEVEEAAAAEEEEEEAEEMEEEAEVAVAAAAAAPEQRGQGKVKVPAAPSTRASVPLEEVTPAWGFLNLHPLLLTAIARLGFRTPTAVQMRTIPAALEYYKDVVGAAATGSGKTMAYSLPIVARLLQRREAAGMACSAAEAAATDMRIARQWQYLPALILTPTRELAMQVCDHLTALLQETALRVVPIVGGLAAPKQKRLLARRPDIIVATPGRFWDLVSTNTPYLTGLPHLQFLVLDEADRLVEKGHFAALNSILAALRAPRAEAAHAEGEAFVDPDAERIIAELEAKRAAAAPKPTVAQVEPEEGSEEEGSDASADEDADAAAQEGESEGAEGADTSSAVDEEEARLVCLPAHVRRQTFLFSATLGLTTAQSIKDAASALVAAQTATSSKLSKAARRKALAEAAKLTPVEALMARVGLLGKPAVIQVKAAAAPSATALPSGAAATLTSAPHAGGDEEEADAALSSEPAASGAGGVALPPGLRICRISCLENEKDQNLYQFLLRYPGRTIIFVNAIATLRRLAMLLTTLKLPVHAMHANMLQRQRLTQLERFRADPNAILVATDVAARGLDIPAVQYVLHYSLPHSAEFFVHRCGRTARAATAGLAAALIEPEDQKQYTKIMTVLRMELGLPEFPLDASFTRKLVTRISLARKIVKFTSELNQASSTAHWLTKTASAAGVEVDDDLRRELGMAASLLGSGKKGGKRRDGGGIGAEQEEEEEDGGGLEMEDSKRSRLSKYDVEDDAAAERVQQKRKQAEITALRRQLAEALKQTVLPTGTSQRYITTNPLLDEAPHPFQSSIIIERTPALEDASHATLQTSAGACASAAVATPPARSGNALVAPRVILPGMRSGAVATAGRDSALSTLAKRGKHVFIPRTGAAVAAAKKGGALPRKAGKGAAPSAKRARR